MSCHLEVDQETEVGDIADFVKEQLSNPVISGDVTVYNLNTFPMDTDAFQKWRHNAYPGNYIIPFQISATWAVMERMLPPQLDDAELLCYLTNDERYEARPRRAPHVATEAAGIHKELARVISDEQ